MTMNLKATAMAVAIGFGVFLAAQDARAAEIVVVSSGAMKEVLENLLPQFEKASGHKVTRSFTAKGEVATKMRSGVPADLLVTNPDLIDDLIKEGKVVAGSSVEFVRSGAGVAVRAGAPKPNIATVDSFKKALLDAKKVAYSGGPSGIELMKALQGLGIADQVKAKGVVAKAGEPVGAIVARGDADIGIQQITELLPVAGLDYVGPLPKELQGAIVYATATPANAKEREAAKALVAFISSEAAVPVIKRVGLEPAR